MSTSRIELDLAAVDRNVQVIRGVLDPSSLDSAGGPVGASGGGTERRRGRVQLCAVIKQDAYGLGAPRVSKRLASSGVDMLAVYGPDEARALAEAPFDTPILVMMPVRTMERADVLYRLAVRSRLHLVVHDLTHASELAALAGNLGTTLPVHVQVDTGMSRGGCLPEQAGSLVQLVTSTARLRLAGVMTHFSSPGSDESTTLEQARAFRVWLDAVRPMLPTGCVIHAANSVASVRSRNLHATMARVGQALYGYALESITDRGAVEFADDAARLEPAVRWISGIAHVTEIPKGWPVGYGRTWRAQRPSRIALIPVGYADGYPLALGNQAKVRLTGRRWDRPRSGIAETDDLTGAPMYAPVVGRVSMDQVTVDVTGLPESASSVGCEVELIGRDRTAPNHLPTLARQAGSVPHQLLCAVNPRVERVYLFSTTGDDAGSAGARPVLAGPSARITRGEAVRAASAG